jgi:hypothetical protein
MASEVDICNLALAHIGQARQITAISPPDGSAEAAHCHRFYPMARDIILEAHYWGFATKRVGLALTGTAPGTWEFSYAWPNGALDIQQILLEEDDTPQEFAVETQGAGQLIYTNVEDAQAKYSALITDTNRFSNTFKFAVSHMLASFLAGPIIKGKAGQAVADKHEAKAFRLVGQAQLRDANNQKEQVHNAPAYAANRVKSPSRRSRG